MDGFSVLTTKTGCKQQVSHYRDCPQRLKRLGSGKAAISSDFSPPDGKKSGKSSYFRNVGRFETTFRNGQKKRA
jgi:hypothetical protein